MPRSELFSTLSKILAQGLDGLTLTLTQDKAGVMVVTVLPRPGSRAGADDEDRAALATPLVLMGTAAELDDEFIAKLTTFGEARGSMATQLEAALNAFKKNETKSKSRIMKALEVAAARSAQADTSTKSAAGAAGRQSGRGSPAPRNTPTGTDNATGARKPDFTIDSTAEAGGAADAGDLATDAATPVDAALAGNPDVSLFEE